MKHKAAVAIAGAITLFVMVVAIGLVMASSRFNTATAASVATTPAPSIDGSQTGEVGRLEAEVASYRAQLEEAYSELQQAYDQINTLSASNSGNANIAQSGGEDRERNSERDEREEHSGERVDRSLARLLGEHDHD